jgi:hypothetical protein
MTATRDDYIRAVVAETLAEQQRLHHEDIDAVALKTMAIVLTSFGIEDGDHRELRADLQHLRRWRKSVEQAQTDTTDNVASANEFYSRWLPLVSAATSMGVAQYIILEKVHQMTG